jgi:hypothetical protein
MPKDKDTKFSVTAQGGKSKYGAGGGGRVTMKKDLAKDLELQAYLDGYVFDPKNMVAQKKITGGGLSLTKRFKKGGVAKASPKPKVTKKKVVKRGTSRRS